MFGNLALLAGLLSVVFYVFIGWVALSHVKEMRRQSALLEKIARALVEKQDKG